MSPPIRSLDDYNKEDNAHRGQANPYRTYAGGEKSGLAIDHPLDAEKNGVADENSARSSPPPDLNIVIVLYSDGFVINGGPLRSLDEEANRQMLKSIREGTATEELAKFARNGEVCVLLQDRSHQSYDGPKSSMDSSNLEEVKLFQGEGRRVGKEDPPTKGNVDVSRGKIVLGDDDPRTTLQFRFHDGTRLRQEFSENMTFQEVLDFVSSIAPTESRFELFSGFPGAPLKCEANATLRACNLLNASLTQRVVL